MFFLSSTDVEYSMLNIFVQKLKPKVHDIFNELKSEKQQ